MTQNKFISLQAVLLCLLMLCFTACRDMLYDEMVGEGECVLRGGVEFRDHLPALSMKTRSSAGTAMDGVDTLWVLLYDEQEQLVEKHRLVSGMDFTPGQNLSGGQQASFSLKVPYGRYYIYAAANVGDLEERIGDIQTVDGLKSLSFDWNAANIAANSQMFGQFAVVGGQQASGAGLLTVNKKSMSLHAGMSRAASKVTLAYDGSLLEEGVFVYFNSVQVMDIPSSCFLGKDNSAGPNSLIHEGDTITYAADDMPYDEHFTAFVSKGHMHFYPYGDIPHSPTEPALYFYENKQGEGKDKKQVEEYMGGNAIDKDGKPYGTYVEVRGYYRSINPKRIGRGPIVYRFMLGRNISTDYDAERNRHYKLTLRLKGFANDADWHIDYTENPPSIIVPDEYYISYLYNRSMNMPLKINTGGYQLKSLKARILTNNWAPYNAAGFHYASQYDYDVNPGSTQNAPWNGFLSLRKTHYKILTNVAGEEDHESGIHHIIDNKSYYTSPSRHLGERTYDVAPGIHYAEDGDYTLTYNDNDNTVDVQLPFYTRAKQLIPTTGYTGNNPYVAYRRRARVEISAEIGNGDYVRQLVDTCDIFQMRRVVNPKGIYRKHDNIEPFQVTLKILSSEESSIFMPLRSIGTWTAEVAREDGDFISLDGAKTVSGSSGSIVDFKVRFKSQCGATESRCAVIRVNYNNESCQHLIFVRQGYAPIEMIPGGVKWHTFNLESKKREVASPCDEGSLFRYGNLRQPIAASNQKNKRSPWVSVGPDDFSSDKDTLFTIVDGVPSKWAGITYDNISVDNPRWTDDLELSGARMARYNDYNALLNNSAIEFNYGVLYGDEASETASNIEDAYGYRSGKEATTQNRGMRGCFVYNSVTGKNLFFPIGASGYGRRRDLDKDWSYPNKNASCVLRYGGRVDYYPEPGLKDRPLFYDIFMRPGAIYWFEKRESGKNVLDINYFSFDFDLIDINSTQNDACFIRCVDE